MIGFIFISPMFQQQFYELFVPISCQLMQCGFTNNRG